MSKVRRPEEDPITYRIAYARAAQALHVRTDDAEDRVVAGPEIPLTEKMEGAIEAAVAGASLDELLSEIASPADEALQLVEMARAQLVLLGNLWVARPIAWYEPRMRLRRRWRRWRSADPKLPDFLTSVVEPATVVLLFSARVQEGWGPRFEDAAPPSEKLDRRFGLSGEDAPDEWLHQYLNLLREPSADVNYRVRYNLACLFSRAAWVSYLRDGGFADAYLIESATHLRLAVAGATGPRRRSMVEWAWRDPALSGLRRMDTERFTQIVGPRPENA